MSSNAPDSAIDTAQGKRSTSALPGPDELVADVAALVSPPGVYLQLQELMCSSVSSASDFAEVIARDPSLAARVLRLCNSAYYRLQARVDTVTRAITLLGLGDIYTLALTVSAVSSFSRIATTLVNTSTFWRHSVLTGIIARDLARRVGILHPERMFVAGVLHDIGYLVLFHRLAPVMQDLLMVAEGDEALLHEAEQRALGFTHAEVGARLFELWHLPPALVHVAAHHHAGLSSRPEMREAGLIHLSDRLAEHAGVGALFEAGSEESSIAGVLQDGEILGLHQADIVKVQADAMGEFTETAAAFTR